MNTNKRALTIILSLILLFTTVLGPLNIMAQDETEDETVNYITDDMLTDNGSSDVEAFGPTPTETQYNYQRQEMSAFLHFSISTFNGKEWSYGDDPVETFSLTTPIDADGYVKTLKDAGFKMVIVTAKHHDGFCIWPSAYTDYDIASTEYGKNGSDVLKEVSAACTKYGIEMGLYLSPWDMHDPSYGYFDEAGNSTTAENDHLDYNDYYVNQLNEILGNDDYGCNGKFTEIWLDGAKGSGSYAQEYDFDRFIETMYTHEGEDLLLYGTSNRNIMWIGNESGIANEETWALGYGTHYEGDKYHTITGHGSYVAYSNTNCYPGAKGGNYWLVPEADARITSGWFWGEDKKTPKTLDELKNMYLKSVGHNAVLLLNVPLNNQGTLDEDIKNRLIEWSSNINTSFHQNNLLEEDGVVVSASEVRNNDIKFKPSNVTDSDDTTYWAAEDGSRSASLHIDFGKTVAFDAVTMEEDIRFGQRIESFTVEYKNSVGIWVEYSKGTTIGSKRIILEKPVQTSELRITFNSTSRSGVYGAPVISSVGVYKASAEFAVGSAAPDGIDEYDSADTEVFTDVSEWTAVQDLAVIGGSYLEGSAGSDMTVSFSGSYAWLVGEIGTEETVLSISIDGKDSKTVTLKGDTVEQLARIFETDTLDDGDHTLSVEVVSGTARIDGLYVLSNGGKGFLDFEYATYTVDEDMFFDVKIIRKGGSVGAISAIVQDNPGSAVQSSYHTTEGIQIDFAEGETEKTVTVRTKRYTETTGTLTFSLAIVPATEEEVVAGFNSPTYIYITDAESYEGGYLQSIQIDSAPSVLTYRTGDTLNLTGLKVSGNYANGDTRLMYEDQYTVDTETLTKIGPVPVTVSSVFDGRSAQFTVMVYANGDTDQNGQVDITDLVRLNKDAPDIGDLDRSGTVDKYDLSMLRQHLLGIISVTHTSSGAMSNIVGGSAWEEYTETIKTGLTEDANDVYTLSGEELPSVQSAPFSANYIIAENPKSGISSYIMAYDGNGELISSTEITENTVYVGQKGYTYRVRLTGDFGSVLTPYLQALSFAPSVIAAEKLDADLYADYKVINPAMSGNTTWNAVGDSITQDASYYYNSVVASTGLSGKNYGLGGSTVAVNEYSRGDINNAIGSSYEYTSIVERILLSSYRDADIWTVSGGTNDWYYGSYIGELKAKGSDFDNGTVYGALQTVCEAILSKENSPRLVLIAPSFANRSRAPKPYYKCTYEEIITAFDEVAELYGVELLNLWDKGGITAENADEMLKDGVHPTAEGSALLVKAIERALRLPDTIDNSKTVTMEKLELKYDDYHTFENANKVSLSSGNGCVTLDGNTIHAVGTTVSPVPVMADYVLYMVTVKKAEVSIILVDGQSNARGTAGELNGTAPLTAEKGNAYMWLNGGLTDMNTYVNGQIASAGNSSIGFYPALAAEWYELTGQKVIVIHKGYDGAPVHFWSSRGYISKHVSEIEAAIQAVKANGNFEIASAGYYWLQGGSNMILEANTSGYQDYEVYTTPSQYVSAYLTIHNSYITALEKSGVTAFAGILSNRSRDCVKGLSVFSEYAGARAAQQYLANNYDNIYMASSLADTWNQTGTDAYTFTAESGKQVSVSAVKNLFAYAPVHYSQAGYNAVGMDAADGIFKALGGAEAKDFTLYGEDGVTKYAENDIIYLTDNLRRTGTQNSFEENAAQLAAVISPTYGRSSGMTVTAKDLSGQTVTGIIEANGYISDITKVTKPLVITVTVNGISKDYRLLGPDGKASDFLTYCDTLGAELSDTLFSSDFASASTTANDTLPANWQFGNYADNSVSWNRQGKQASVKDRVIDSSGTVKRGILLEGNGASTVIGTKDLGTKNYVAAATLYYLTSYNSDPPYFRFVNNVSNTTLSTYKLSVKGFKFSGPKKSDGSTTSTFTASDTSYNCSDYMGENVDKYSRLDLTIYSYGGYNYYFIDGKLVGSHAQESRDTTGDVVAFSAWGAGILITDLNVYALSAPIKVDGDIVDYTEELGASITAPILTPDLSAEATTSEGTLPSGWQFGTSSGNSISWNAVAKKAKIASAAVDANGTVKKGIYISGHGASTVIGTAPIDTKNYVASATLYFLGGEHATEQSYFKFFNNVSDTALASGVKANTIRIDGSLSDGSAGTGKLFISAASSSTYTTADLIGHGITQYTKLDMVIVSYGGYNHYFINGKLIASATKSSRDNAGDVIGFSSWYSKLLITDFSVYGLEDENAAGIGAEIGDAIYVSNFDSESSTSYGTLPSGWQIGACSGNNKIDWNRDGTSAQIAEKQIDAEGNTEKGIYFTTVAGSSTVFGTTDLGTKNYVATATVYYLGGIGDVPYYQMFNNVINTTLSAADNGANSTRIYGSLADGSDGSNKILINGKTYYSTDYSDGGVTPYSKLTIKLYSFNGYNNYYVNGRFVASYEKTSRDTEGDLVGFSVWYSKALLTDFSVYELN